MMHAIQIQKMLLLQMVP